MSDIKREHREVSVLEIEPIPENIREMKPEEFNMLVKSIEENGFVEPIQVVEKCDGGYLIVNGQHRYDALVEVFGVNKVPVMILGKMCCDGEDPQENNCWDEIRYWTEVIRLNNIRGDWLKPALAKRIMDLWEKYKKKGYDRIEFKEKLGFLGEKSIIDKLLDDVKKTLPEDMRKKLEEKKDKIDTVEDLSKIVGEIMRRHGKTIEYSYIIFSLGGAQHIMIKADEELWYTISNMLDEARINEIDAKDLLKKIFEKIDVYKVMEEMKE